MQDSAPLVRFSDFLGIGYFGNERQHIVAPIFYLRQSAEQAWARVIEAQLFHIVFVEHPVELKPHQINLVLYRSFSSLDSLHKLKGSCGGSAFIKFGWHDLTKAQKFDVLAQYAAVDSVEFKKDSECWAGFWHIQYRRIMQKVLQAQLQRRCRPLLLRLLLYSKLSTVLSRVL